MPPALTPANDLSMPGPELFLVSHGAASAPDIPELGDIAQFVFNRFVTNGRISPTPELKLALVGGETEGNRCHRTSQ